MSSITDTKPQSTDKTAWLNVLVLWFVGIFAAMQFAKFSISYDNLLATYEVSSASIGILISIVGGVGLLCGVVAGVLSGHLGYQKVLIGALGIGGTMSLLQASLPSYSILLISRAIEGFSHLGIVVAAPTLMLRMTAANAQSLVMGLWGTFFGVAFAITGWGGGYLLSHYGLSGLYFFHALLSLPLMAYFLIFTKKDLSVTEACTSLSLHHLLKSTIRVYLNPRTFLPGMVFLFHTCMFVALLTFIPRITSDQSVMALLFIALPLFSILGTFMAGALSQFFIRPPVLIMLAYAFIGLLTFCVITVDSNQVLFIMTALLLMVASGVVQGATFSLIPYLSKEASEQAMGNGAIAQLGNVGATIGPPIFAYCIEVNGYYGLFILVAGLCVVGCVTGLISRRY